jgi:hypothetical protein
MSDKKDHNTSYTIRVRDPLLRPGMEIEAGPVSEDYVVETAERLMRKIREINDA